MFGYSRCARVITWMVKPRIESVEHPVIGTYINYLPARSILDKKVRVAWIPLNNVIAIPWGGYDRGRSINDIPEFPCLERAGADREAPISQACLLSTSRRLASSDKIDDGIGRIGSGSGPKIGTQRRGVGRSKVDLLRSINDLVVV
jgi:hypothetical protein